MPWIVLSLSGVLEAVWATALGKSAGFTKLVPTLVFGAGIIASMAGLAFALREIPIGTGYAVWVGIGATLTVVYAMVTGTESLSILKIVLLLGLIGCVIGLKLVSDAGH
ncbi:MULTISPECIES: multidrug efflux SMR transporter [Cryobacterium]|uniref:Multidrug efflux SMR transporter n=1 Tax=Cryobacterium glucosi TaxID=1259175 RepID=A0ABY2IPP5_9MICO|nr:MULTISPECIES: multidrug efflux SMR transporter [Cryobacterium]TFB97767.1 multidrug efflux SMR transporter [Cryobacterium sp. MDB2-A-1]TFC07888.1 multidrug efflux SMR transporter [Cryobacterium sp. MDB2-A-2]TFC11757.1 multidrug efflux SMR transporter [Cryobacterium sp. MDB2-33-2]TFC21119.1 multidrug efflux SMR transporter [Cryobacterium sp. MDB2-10]TFC21896.1 multidrug efflux SMR transporter [Cryobacterium glucosi]